MRTQWAVWMVVAGVLVPGANALAQEGTGGETTEPQVSADADTRTPAEQHRTADAASNRSFLFPAAETTPEGFFEISDYELVLLTLAYGVTNSLQLSLTFMPPLIEDQPFFAWLSGKYAFVRSDTVVFSGLLSFNVFSSEGETALFVTVGPLVDIIFGPDARGVVTFGLTTSWVLAAPGDEEGLEDFDDSAIALTSAISYQVAKIVKVMLEIDTAAVLADGDLDFANGVLITYGVRFFNDTLSGDIAFIRPAGSDIDTGDLIMGIPFVTFTARF